MVQIGKNKKKPEGKNEEGERESFLEKEAFFDSLDEKFNSLWDPQGSGNAKRVINAYLTVFLFMFKAAYDVPNENLALWYLYAGIGGQGVRISLTKTQIKKLIEESTYELREKAHLDEEPLKLVMELERNKTMKVAFQDVMYYGENQNNGIDLRNL